MGCGEEILRFQTRIFESQFHVVFIFVHEKAFYVNVIISAFQLPESSLHATYSLCR